MSRIVIYFVVLSVSFAPVLDTAQAQRWIPLPPPPEMPGDNGHWWLDTDSIVQNGSYTLFDFVRSPDRDTPPLSADYSGRTAIDCATGLTLLQGVCTGTCTKTGGLPETWLKSTPFPPQSALFKAVCSTPPPGRPMQADPGK